MEAVVVLSGGQDSTTVLFEAIRRHGAENVTAITFDYRQRHRAEIEAAFNIAGMAGVHHDVFDLGVLSEVAASAQTRFDIPVNLTGGLNGLPSTFTPGRNTVFIAIAASFALSRGCSRLYLGVCQTDFSGYPDCRREFIDAMERAVALSVGQEKFEILTPLMELTKAESVHLAVSLPGCMDALRHSVTCYEGKVPGCGVCPACVLRAKGFAEAGVSDPAR